VAIVVIGAFLTTTFTTPYTPVQVRAKNLVSELLAPDSTFSDSLTDPLRIPRKRTFVPIAFLPLAVITLFLIACSTTQAPKQEGPLAPTTLSKEKKPLQHTLEEWIEILTKDPSQKIPFEQAAMLLDSDKQLLPKLVPYLSQVDNIDDVHPDLAILYLSAIETTPLGEKATAHAFLVTRLWGHDKWKVIRTASKAFRILSEREFPNGFKEPFDEAKLVFDSTKLNEAQGAADMFLQVRSPRLVQEREFLKKKIEKHLGSGFQLQPVIDLLLYLESLRFDELYQKNINLLESIDEDITLSLKGKRPLDLPRFKKNLNFIKESLHSMKELHQGLSLLLKEAPSSPFTKSLTSSSQATSMILDILLQQITDLHNQFDAQKIKQHQTKLQNLIKDFVRAEEMFSNYQAVLKKQTNNLKVDKSNLDTIENSLNDIGLIRKALEEINQTILFIRGIKRKYLAAETDNERINHGIILVAFQDTTPIPFLLKQLSEGKLADREIGDLALLIESLGTRQEVAIEVLKKMSPTHPKLLKAAIIRFLSTTKVETILPESIEPLLAHLKEAKDPKYWVAIAHIFKKMGATRKDLVAALKVKLDQLYVVDIESTTERLQLIKEMEEAIESIEQGIEDHRKRKKEDQKEKRSSFVPPSELGEPNLGLALSTIPLLFFGFLSSFWEGLKRNGGVFGGAIKSEGNPSPLNPSALLTFHSMGFFPFGFLSKLKKKSPFAFLFVFFICASLMMAGCQAPRRRQMSPKEVSLITQTDLMMFIAYLKVPRDPSYYEASLSEILFIYRYELAHLSPEIVEVSLTELGSLFETERRSFLTQRYLFIFAHVLPLIREDHPILTQKLMERIRRRYEHFKSIKDILKQKMLDRGKYFNPELNERDRDLQDRYDPYDTLIKSFEEGIPQLNSPADPPPSTEEPKPLKDPRNSFNPHSQETERFV